MRLRYLPAISSAAASDIGLRVAKVVAEFAVAPANSEFLTDRVRGIVLDPCATRRMGKTAIAIAGARRRHWYTDDFERFVDRVQTAPRAC